MKINLKVFCAAILLICFGAFSGFGQTKKTAAAAKAKSNAVCSNPDKPCNHKSKKFDAWELSFKMPAKITDNKTYLSEPFYAVILKMFEVEGECDGGEYISAAETERKKVQKKFPEQKVFADYQCPNLSAVGYDFDGRIKDDRLVIGNFIAIYAGETKADGEKILQAVKKDYPSAMLKKMTAAYENIVQ